LLGRRDGTASRGVTHRRRIYLAGPEVFLPDAAMIGRRKKELCLQYGFVGLFPLDTVVEADERADRRIYQANLRMIREADAAIFNLTPFRGVSADVGTVFELGVVVALGKPAFGYTNVASCLRARVPGAGREGDVWRDANGCSIEDFNNADNLMIDASLAEGMNALVRHDAGGAIDDLEAFAQCLVLAAERMRVPDLRSVGG
jgi:nucleoside 2-deoxyribosyltransferase